MTYHQDIVEELQERLDVLDGLCRRWRQRLLSE